VPAHTSTLQSRSLERTDSDKMRGLRVGFYYFYIGCWVISPSLLRIPARYVGFSGDEALAVTWNAIHYVALLLVILRLRQNGKNLSWLVLTLLYLGFSIALSSQPDVSSRYGLALAGTILTAYLISTDLSAKELLTITFRVITVLAALSVVLYIAGAGIAFYDDAANRPNVLGGEPLKGLFAHKILAGFYACLAAPIVLLQPWSKFKKSIAILFLFLVVLTTSSSTALVLFPTSFVGYGLARYGLTRNLKAVHWFGLLITSLTICLLVLWMSWAGVLGALGRDLTLTGRTLLWAQGLTAWTEKPLFGWGYGAYMHSPEATAISENFEEFRNYDVPHLHQTYIQIAVDFGLIGLGFLIFVLLRTASLSYSKLGRTDPRLGATAFSIVFLIAVAGLVAFIIPSYMYTGGPTVLILSMYLILRSRPVEEFEALNPASISRKRA